MKKQHLIKGIQHAIGDGQWNSKEASEGSKEGKSSGLTWKDFKTNKQYYRVGELILLDSLISKESEIK